MFFDICMSFYCLKELWYVYDVLAFAQKFNYERQSKELSTRLAWPTWHVTNTKGFRLSCKLRSLHFDQNPDVFDRRKGRITERSQEDIHEVRGTKMFNELRKMMNRRKKSNEWLNGLNGSCRNLTHPTSSLKLTIWIINCYFPDDEKYFVLVWQQNTRISCPHVLAHCLWWGRNTTVAVTHTFTHTPSCYVPDYQKSSSLSWQRDCNFCSTSPVTLQIV